MNIIILTLTLVRLKADFRVVDMARALLNEFCLSMEILRYKRFVASNVHDSHAHNMSGRIQSLSGIPESLLAQKNIDYVFDLLTALQVQMSISFRAE